LARTLLRYSPVPTAATVAATKGTATSLKHSTDGIINPVTAFSLCGVDNDFLDYILHVVWVPVVRV